jgi:immune inhibitor A
MPSGFRFVPPAPQVLAQLYADYLRYRAAVRGKPVSFKRYLKRIGFTDPTARFKGGDDGRRRVPSGATRLVAVPTRAVSGDVRVLVLLVDFPDKPARRAPHEFEDMLFSKGTFQTGSLNDYYAEVTLGKVNVLGSVHGWLRMPRKYDYYVNNQSGTGDYPRNAQKLTEDALAAARKLKVPFDTALDNFGDGSITALVVVHAGRGAETFTNPLVQKVSIWSHKADLQAPVQVTPDLIATNYLTIPEDARMGVCAHELGHLLLQWDDFYDPNYDEDGSEWDGSGVWDLMAGGSWNNGGLTPAHPAALHKLQHGWTEVQDILVTTAGVVLPPYSKTFGKVVRIRGPHFKPTQSLVLENRRRTGFDRMLPGEGLLVWRVDTALEMNRPDNPAMALVQADGRHDLNRPDDQHAGDAGDPFPGPEGKHVDLADTGNISTSFPAGPSGITLSKITLNSHTGIISLDIKIA